MRRDCPPGAVVHFDRDEWDEGVGFEKDPQRRNRGRGLFRKIYTVPSSNGRRRPTRSWQAFSSGVKIIMESITADGRVGQKAAKTKGLHAHTSSGK